LARTLQNSDWTDAGFSISLPLQDLPLGATSLTLAAHSPEHGTWYSTLGVVVPNLGRVPARVPLVQANPLPAPALAPPPSAPALLHAEVESPQPGDQVSRSFVILVLASGADRVDVFLEPDRDDGGRLVGSSTLTTGNLFKVTVNTPPDGHTLYVHVSSTSTGQEQVLTIPVVVRS
jgi:hypothetical protein